MNFTEQEEEFLLEAVKTRKAVLLMGAGASFKSRDRSGKDLPLGKNLAALIAKLAKIPYTNEELSEVVEACLDGILSKQNFEDFIKSLLTQCSASVELKNLFSYPWRRVYTLNMDDTVERIGRLPDGRRVDPFNGLVDRVAPVNTGGDLQLVHLNGFAGRPEHGLIFSASDYNQKLASRNSGWYEQLAADYYVSTTVVIGSQLNEPLLSVELERLKSQGGPPSMSFLIIPDTLSEVKIRALRSKRIHYIQGTLAEFVQFLREKLGSVIKFQDIAKKDYLGVSLKVDISPRDVEVAMALRPIKFDVIKLSLPQQEDRVFAKNAQWFLQGAAPTWRMATSQVPVDLREGQTFPSFLKKAVLDDTRLVVITGQAGSGKSTLAMRTIEKVVSEIENTIVYELSGETRRFDQIIPLIKKLHDGCRTLLYVPHISIYGDSLARDLELISGSEITLVTTARSAEWNEHFRFPLSRYAEVFKLRRFTHEDYNPLSERLLKYVPAPNFTQATPKERYQRFQQSKNQLLIALREITESRRFDDVIEDEYQKLPQDETCDIFHIVGVCTLCRTGISGTMLSVIYQSLQSKRSFHDALAALEGIVSIDQDNRYRIRHELYAEIIFNSRPISFYLEAIERVLEALSQYDVPVIKHVTKNDAALFKELLNYRSLHKRCSKIGQARDGLYIYQRFEKAFELDGHFWLQYGLYCRQIGRIESSLEYLKRSVDAYPENIFAIHALADIKLDLALSDSISNQQATTFLHEAAETLMKLDARDSASRDYYPIATLATKHVAGLHSRSSVEDAVHAARQYFTRVQYLSKFNDQPVLEALKIHLAKYIFSKRIEPFHYTTND